ncbi:endonuclease/exonuclease/phosphatase family protein [Cellulomonas sp. URHB0016]
MTDGCRLRFMTYNLKGLQLDRAAAAQVVRAEGPDVLGIQEPPRGPLGRRRLRRFAAAAGLVVVVNGWGSRTTALLAAPRHTVAGAHAIRLPWRPGTTRRGVSTATVDGVRVVVVHLSLHRQERAEHLDLVVEATVPGTGEPPTVVMGDVNELPGGPAWVRLGRVLTDVAPDGAPTFPAGVPRKRIDAVFVSGRITADGVHVPDGAPVRRGSDHRPVVADLVVSPPDGSGTMAA